MLHGSEISAQNTEDVQKLESNDAVILCWMCKVGSHMQGRTRILREKLGIKKRNYLQFMREETMLIWPCDVDG